MKSWHQSSVDLDNYPLYRQSMQRHYDAVLPAGTEVHFTGGAAFDLVRLVPEQPVAKSEVAAAARLCPPPRLRRMP
jgi:hypothetical protein